MCLLGVWPWSAKQTPRNELPPAHAVLPSVKPYVILHTIFCAALVASSIVVAAITPHRNFAVLLVLTAVVLMWAFWRWVHLHSDQK